MIPLFLFYCLTVVFAQQKGTLTPERHPSLPIRQCSKNGCQTLSTEVVIDANWRWTHSQQGTNCYTGNKWDTSFCPDPVTCAQNCAIDGADYQGTYGVTTNGNALKLNFVTQGPYSKNIGSRLYLLQNDSSYFMFHLKNREFSFEVDVSNLPCGLNGALYLVEMSPDGGLSQYPNNKAGAQYGTGYCDAQCPQDLKFINGEANTLNWQPSPVNPNSGTGKYGSCCNEMDIWEANSVSSAYTPHVCSVKGQTRCDGVNCGTGSNRYNGYCDKDGCDFNSYRLGNLTFYGTGSSVDTSKPFTVVTRFVTSDNTDNGNLVEIQRIYVQDGRTIFNARTHVPGLPSFESVSDKFCNAAKKVFGDVNDFERKGGVKAMGDALSRGMVLVLSLWDDYDVHMLWLDSSYPTDKPPSQPGVTRGTCSTSSGVPSDVESRYPNAHVIYSNIAYGEIGTTVSL